jgi:hypothetical protein
VHGDADVEHRNANFVAVGVLVPVSGALGRVWEHAEELRGLAGDVLGKKEDVSGLDAFWDKWKAEEGSGDGNGNGNGEKGRRGGSESTLPGVDKGILLSDHPALGVTEGLHLFGPLLFPLQRAVLARKRILFLGSPPVRCNAEVVWLASVLGNVSGLELAGCLPEDAKDMLQTTPLFSIGIHDIAALPPKSDKKGNLKGWLACTTDSILAEKNNLWDVLVKLPTQSPNRTWPTLQTSDGRMIKASQRDLRRWNLLRRELRRLRFQFCGKYPDDVGTESVSENDQRPLLDRRRSSDMALSLQDRDDSAAVEPPTWTSVAYRGFMWWASAGEASAWEEDEVQADEELLFDLPTDMAALSPTIGSKIQGEVEPDYARAAATVLVAYFRRVTERILGTLAGIVEEAEDGTEEGVLEDEVQIRGDDLRQMGLDRWSEADRLLVGDMMEVWFGKKAVVVDEGLTLCGVRLC